MRRLLAGAAVALLLQGCGDGAGVPFGDPGPFISEDFPAGNAFLYGTVLDDATGAGLEGLTITVTPSDGLPLEQELESPVQAEARTNRRGEFAFSGIARGTYVLFVRFDASHLGYGEVIGRVESSFAPSEIRLLPVPVGLGFERPHDGGTVAAADTAILRFTRIRIEELRTLNPESAPLYARVEVHGGGGSGEPNSGDGNQGPSRGRSFEAPLTEADIRRGEVRVPLDAGGLAGDLRLESFLGLYVAYRGPRGGPPGPREIRGEAISVVRR